jgi:5,10-methylenetetrahydromethanopterin reductase
MVLALAATKTERVVLGTAVLVPDLRHVLVTASAIATLEELAPGRVEVAVGTGFTGRMVLGQRPLPWAVVDDYVRSLRALLRGEQVEVGGRLVQMIHPAGCAPPRPITTPIVVAAMGPKGVGIAEAFGDRIMCAGAPQPGFARCSLLCFGTVLNDGEPLDGERVMAAAGPAAAVAYHGLYEADASAVDGMPGGSVWRAAVDVVPERARHLAVHAGHLVELTDRDREALGDGSLIPAVTWTGSPADVRARADAAAAAGATELLYAPIGPDVERELRTFRDAVLG